MNQQIERASFHTSPRPLISIFGHRLSVRILVTFPKYFFLIGIGEHCLNLKFKSVLVRKTNVGTVTIKAT